MNLQEAYKAIQKEASSRCAKPDHSPGDPCACQTLALIERVERLIFYLWDEELENHFTAHEAAIRTVLGMEKGGEE